MDIRHVVVLMLENRSFDSMLGKLRAPGPGFDGLPDGWANTWHDPPNPAQTVPAWNDPGMTPATATIPDPDPGELFADIKVQTHGLFLDSPMDGFVDSYMRQPPAAKPYDKRAPMHYFTPAQVPALSRLATAFGVSDRWFASAPCQTWPNRFFTHCGTAGGSVNNAPARLPFAMPTVFNRLSEAGRDWRLYFHDIPQAITLSQLWFDVPLHFRRFDDFAADAAAGTLAAYSFIEPRYFTDAVAGRLPNDQHPPHNVTDGEHLIATVYNALRAGPAWHRTLLIVTYDEHGGCADHVPPPDATPPGGPYPDGFRFDRFGVRVPAVIVSPYVRPGSVLRAPGPVPFDHTTIIATLRALWNIGPLTARDAAAPHLLGLLTDQPDNDGPARIDALPLAPPAPIAVAAVKALPANDLQASLGAAAAHLPTLGADPARHAARVASGPIPVQAGLAATAEFVAAQMKAFLGEA
ncbi:MAG TPA: alkaline phosphatase family protein [Acetobacteraceae bacterium]|nr:alkaline phosphatase family protein [Acetobacteraceae bacterium]